MGTARAHAPRVQTAFRALLLHTFGRLDCAANAKINYDMYRYSLYTRYQWWSSCSDLTNTVRSRSQTRRRGSATYIYIYIHVAATHKCSAGTETSSL